MHSKKHPPRGLLFSLDAVIVFLFLLSIMQPFLFQTALMRIQAYERSMDDARVSLLMQISQQLYNRGAALHLRSNDVSVPENYTQVGYYDSGWNQNPGAVLPALVELNLSSTVLDSPPAGPPPAERVCLSRLMVAGPGVVHALWICDS